MVITSNVAKSISDETSVETIEDWIIDKLNENSDVVEALFKDISSEMVWQEKAISTLKNVIEELISWINLNANGYNKPIGSMIFPWPSWVWKTLLSKLTQKIFNNFYDNNLELIKINCADFPGNDPYGLTRLIWSSAGYVGSDLKSVFHPDNVHGKWRVILFDEAEKAWPPLWNLLLSILDDWTLDVNFTETERLDFLKFTSWKVTLEDHLDKEDDKSDAKSSSLTTFFKDTIIIITTNVWNDVVEKNLTNKTIGFGGWNDNISSEDIESMILEELWKQFRIELQWRFDYIVPFQHLTKENVSGIVDILSQRLISNNLHNSNGFVIEFSSEAKEYMISEIFNHTDLRKYGWRFIESFFKENIIPNIARIINSKIFTQEDNTKYVLHIWLKNNEIIYSKIPVNSESSLSLIEATKDGISNQLET